MEDVLTWLNTPLTLTTASFLALLAGNGLLFLFLGKRVLRDRQDKRDYLRLCAHALRLVVRQQQRSQKRWLDAFGTLLERIGMLEHELHHVHEVDDDTDEDDDDEGRH